jgi:hypothetical protein
MTMTLKPSIKHPQSTIVQLLKISASKHFNIIISGISKFAGDSLTLPQVERTYADAHFAVPQGGPTICRTEWKNGMQIGRDPSLLNVCRIGKL